MATIQIERRKRGPFGWIVLTLFWLFNLFMLATCATGMNGASQVYEQAGTDAEKAGSAIGMTMGLGMILFIWFLGAAILGMMMYFTRGTKIIETKEVPDK